MLCAVTLITSPPSDCSQHLTPESPAEGAWLLFFASLDRSRRADVGRLPAYGTAHALPLATRDGRGHPPHTHMLPVAANALKRRDISTKRH